MKFPNTTLSTQNRISRRGIRSSWVEQRYENLDAYTYRWKSNSLLLQFTSILKSGGNKHIGRFVVACYLKQVQPIRFARPNCFWIVCIISEFQMILASGICFGPVSFGNNRNFHLTAMAQRADHITDQFMSIRCLWRLDTAISAANIRTKLQTKVQDNLSSVAHWTKYWTFNRFHPSLSGGCLDGATIVSNAHLKWHVVCITK